MKILTPIKAYDELEMLIENGAEELYCGITPQEWQAKYTGAFWLSRRSPKGGGVETYGELRRLVDGAHRASVPVFITLNAPMYTREQTEDVITLAKTLDQEIGVDAFIVGDINLLMELSARKLRPELHISSILAALNLQAIRFLENFGPKRVVLPRSVTLPEIEHITAALRGRMEVEVFILNEGCAFEEGFCSTTHHHSVGAFCTGLSDMEVEFQSVDGGKLGPRQTVRLRRNLLRYREYVWYLNGNGCSSTPSGLPYGPCGLCAIHDLHRIGVDSLKIVGREVGAFRKLASLKMVRDIVAKTRAGADRLYTIERAQSLRQTPEHCRAGYMCYYRGEGADYRPARPAVAESRTG